MPLVRPQLQLPLQPSLEIGYRGPKSARVSLRITSCIVTMETKMTTLEANVQRHADGTLHVFLTGTMDEESDFDGVFARLDGDVVLDLSGVRRVNSIGVHRWIEAISQFSREHDTAVEACSYVVALQAGCIANLFGSAKVRSTLAPYFCPSCNDSRTVNIAADEIEGKDAMPPAKRCPVCETVMAFDELDNYFDFLVGSER
jgi:hypothetical protein